MNHSVRVLLTGLIDYAGLFPPAGLGMETAVRNYAAYRQSKDARWLGRFIVPVARLGEFEEAAAEHGSGWGWEGEGWRLSALAGADLAADLKKIAEFNQRHLRSDSRVGAVVDTIEVKAECAEHVEGAMKLVRRSLTPYFEIPVASDPAELIGVIARSGARAKVRTGGLSEQSFPSSFELARFITACAAMKVAFKATAGLHHPLRSVHRLTYEPDSPSALMHGFLNLFLAAAFAYDGLGVDKVAELLEERAIEAFRFDGQGVAWRAHRLTNDQLSNARRYLAIAFGSCSFEEPIRDLKALHLL